MTSPEIPMPYCDEADNEISGFVDDCFFTDEDEHSELEENEEYHLKMISLKKKLI